MNLNIYSWFVIFPMLLLLSSVVYMLYVISKQGDERRQLIKMRAMSVTFIFTVLFVLIETLRNGAGQETNPLIILFAMAITFLISLIVMKKKYGD